MPNNLWYVYSFYTHYFRTRWHTKPKKVVKFVKPLPHLCPWHRPNPKWITTQSNSSTKRYATNKRLRISYVYEVNNNKIQLLSRSHTFKLHQMHYSISNYNTQRRMTYECSDVFLSHDWVTPSRILLLVISPSFPHFPYVSITPVSMHKVTPPYACMNGKNEGPFRSRGLPMISSSKLYFYHGLETCATAVTMVTLLHSSTSLLYFQHGKHDHCTCMYTKDLTSI